MHPSDCQSSVDGLRASRRALNCGRVIEKRYWSVMVTRDWREKMFLTESNVGNANAAGSKATVRAAVNFILLAGNISN